MRTTCLEQQKSAMSNADRRILCAIPSTHETCRHIPDFAPNWLVDEAMSPDHACFLLQHDGYDALVLDEQFLGGSRPSALDRLLARRDTPEIFLSDASPASAARALESGADLWLPRDLAMGSPSVLRAALVHAFRQHDWRDRSRQTRRAHHACRHHISQLLQLLWPTSPQDNGRWLSQQQVLERLQQETGRCRRYGASLSVAIAESSGSLSTTARIRVLKSLRQSDVAGQYGPHGFLLLLPETPEPSAAVCCWRLQALIEPDAGPPAFGIASYAAAAPTQASLLGRAEERLDEAKKNGGIAF
jgi:hypothetical protein